MSIRINGKTYRSGTVVRANPVEEATSTLEKIGIGSDVYEIQGGGSSDKVTEVYDVVASGDNCYIVVDQHIWLDDGGGSVTRSTASYEDITSASGFIARLTETVMDDGGSSYNTNVTFSFNETNKTVTMSWGTLSGSSGCYVDIVYAKVEPTVLATDLVVTGTNSVTYNIANITQGYQNLVSSNFMFNLKHIYSDRAGKGTDSPFNVSFNQGTGILTVSWNAIGTGNELTGDVLLLYRPNGYRKILDMAAPNSGVNGYHGYVPAPLVGDETKFLKGDGTWSNPQPTLIKDAQFYSLDEQVVGVWTDGKPLYQKTVVLNSISTGENLYTLDFVNVDTIVAKEVSCIREPQGSTKDYIIDESILELWGEGSVIPQIWRVNANNVQVSLYSGYYTPTNISITLKYTKTTDTAGSGGYQAYGFSPVIYSTEEREIGVWTDNKPLYQKTIAVGALPNTTTKTVAHNISNIAFIAKVYGTAYNSTNGYTLPLEDTDADAGISGVIRVFANSTNIFISTKRDQSEYDVCFVTLQYTKTTDVAGSGSYNTLGVPTVHYTTDEQVIGTWIDGKPLYRKTVTYTGVSGARNSLDLNIANVDFINLVPEGSCADNRPLPYVTGTDNSNNIGGFFDVQTSTTTFEWRAGSGSTSSTDVILTVQYTKTTD